MGDGGTEIRLDRLSAVILLSRVCGSVTLLQTFHFRSSDRIKYSAVANNQAHSRIIAKPGTSKIYDHQWPRFSRNDKIRYERDVLKTAASLLKGTLSSAHRSGGSRRPGSPAALNLCSMNASAALTAGSAAVKDAKSRVRQA